MPDETPSATLRPSTPPDRRSGSPAGGALGLASIVLGIVALLAALRWWSIAGLVAGIAGLTCALLARRRVGGSRGVRAWGVVLNAAGAGVALVVLIVSLVGRPDWASHSDPREPGSRSEVEPARDREPGSGAVRPVAPGEDTP